MTHIPIVKGRGGKGPRSKRRQRERLAVAEQQAALEQAQRKARYVKGCSPWH
jgi:hypothetical protein